MRPFFHADAAHNSPIIRPSASMSAPLSQQSLVEDTLVHLPMLARQVQDAIHDALGDGAQHRSLLEPWQRQRLHFDSRFQQALTPLLQAGARGEDPLRRRPPRGLNELSLVDERQALQDVALAHVIQVVEDQSRTELHQLANFFAALRGTARARKDDNPLRPAIFAQALQQTLQWVTVDGEGQYALMRAAAQALARALGRHYAELCSRLRDAELTPLIGANRGQLQQSDQQRLRRATSAYQEPTAPAVTEPATLDGLARWFDARQAQSRPSGDDGRDLLSRLYDRILADPDLPPPVRARLARLQVAVVRLAATDLSLLRDPEHPAWRLLNRISTQGAAFEQAAEARLREFLSFLDERSEGLILHPAPTAALFQLLLGEVETFIGNQARQGSEPSSAALASLEREQQRGAWLRMVREQIQAQLDEAPEALTSAPLREFLRQDWAGVIVTAMVKEGQDAPPVQAHIALVDDLLNSLLPPPDAAARRALRERLPELVRRLEAGCDSVRLEPERRRGVMDELMRLHARLLLGPTLPPAAPGAGMAPPPDREAHLSQLLSERDSLLPASRWAYEDVDRSRLPTVPVTLYDPAAGRDARQALHDWVEHLSIGTWYHLFVQGSWLTAQLAWISEGRQFFLLVGQDADERHSLTRGALEYLLRHGLITNLDDDGVVQRAIATLMQDLTDTP